MAGISLSGLASGLDWKTLVDQLITAEQAPVTALQTKKTTGATQLSAFGTLQTDLTALQTSIKAINADGVFSGRSAKLADSTSTWSATAAAGTEAGQYAFNVTHLATKAKLAGAPDVGASISSLDDASDVTLATMNLNTPMTAGTFTVNGSQITVALTDSLKDVLGRISAATSLTAKYDAGDDQVSLSGTNPIVLGSASDTSNFLSALKLYNNGTKDISTKGTLGVVNTSAAIKDSGLKKLISDVDVDGNGTFSINGVPIAFNSKTDSVQALMNRVNASSAGVKMAYDKNSDQFTLTNNITGDMGITVSELSGGVLDAMGLKASATPVRGQNAEFSINGGNTIVSASNNFDSSLTGITGLSVTATSETTQTVNVAADNSGIRSKIDDFISKYNAVQSYIDAQTKITIGTDGKVTTSTFSSNREVGDMGSSLRAIVFGAVPGLSGSITRLEGIGIDFTSGSSQLAVTDLAKLDDALTNHADSVIKLFNNNPGGIVASIDAFVTNLTRSGGTIASQINILNTQSRDLDDQIARLNTSIDGDKTRLTNGFIAMEQALSNSQTQQQALTAAFDTKSSS